MASSLPRGRLATALALALAACAGDGPADAPDAPDAGGAHTPAADAGQVADAAPLPAGDPDRGPSAGCGNTLARTGLQSRKMTLDGRERTYLRFIPASYDPDVPLALVIALHGTAGTNAAWRDRYALEAEADGEAIFIYPMALPNADGQTKWQAFDPGSRDFAFVDALIAQVEGSHCIDRDRIFVTGFSLGGTFAANLGCWRGDVLRAIAPVGAGGGPVVTPFTGCVGEVADWQAIGDTDDQHTPGSVRIRNHYVGANGCDNTRSATTPAGCETYDGCRAEVPVTWCTYAGGHVWPTMATKGVWRFFASFD